MQVDISLINYAYLRNYMILTESLTEQCISHNANSEYNRGRLVQG